jgi:hypothetical protein
MDGVSLYPVAVPSQNKARDEGLNATNCQDNSSSDSFWTKSPPAMVARCGSGRVRISEEGIACYVLDEATTGRHGAFVDAPTATGTVELC